ncbi:MAG: ATP-binding protein [Clostridia bacterium]|nr:ATP-binding protein [Clostridia bacterium]
MIRYIPSKTRIKVEFMKNITLSDILMLFLALVVAAVIIFANLFGGYKWWALIAWASICISLFVPVDEGLRVYSSIVLLLKFSAYRKKFLKGGKEKSKKYRPMHEIMPFLNIDLGKYINFDNYYGMVLEIKPIALELMQEEAQDRCINVFATALRRLSQHQTVSIIKTRKPMRFDIFLASDDNKFDLLNQLYERGHYSESEMSTRSDIFRERVAALQNAIKAEPILQDHFYILVCGTDKTGLEEVCVGMANDLRSGQTAIQSELVTGGDLVSFLKSNYSEIFDEKEVEHMPPSSYMDWVLPNKIEFGVARTLINKDHYRQFVVSDYPRAVGNAWAANLFSMPNTRVCMKLLPVDKDKGERTIDKVIMERELKLDRTYIESKRMEQQQDLDSLRILLQELKANNEQLYDVNIHFTVIEEQRKELRTVLKQQGFKVSEMFGRQVDAFVSSNVSALQKCKQFARNMPTTTVASAFPFVASYMQDPNGFYLGESMSGYPVFMDFFVRDSRAGRINSNMMVIGKSGSGKSYATKTILTNLAADRTKMFVLDPESEYEVMTRNLGGKVIDVGSNKSGILNPFHIMASLEDLDAMNQGAEDEEFSIDDVVKASSNKTFFTHLQFLEQFFRVILEGISSDAFETLNTIIVELYHKKKIDHTTDISKLKAEDYPIFDDLYKLICDKLKTEKDAYYKQNLQMLQTYIQKFATGGRNSDLWNGPTSILTDENLITFNFQTLFASKNNRLANAQMILIFKYLTNEIINNKKFNEKYKEETGIDIKRQCVLAVDEAHMFIDPDFPVALNFMAEMAKRIRKYQGMQIIITQNIKDFLGSQEIQRRSAAIINARQYSLIFQLAPNDMADLLQLYSSAGGINKQEQDGIVTAARGRCFLISGPVSRQFVDIHALPNVAWTMGEGA